MPVHSGRETMQEPLETMEITEEDLALVHALQISPRVTWTDAGRILGAHPTALAARWERLRASGTAWVTANLISSGMDTTLAFLDIECALDRRAEVVRAVCAIPEVVSVEEPARNRDLLLTVVTSSLAELSQSVVPQLASIAGLTRYQASVCTRLHSGGESWRLNILNKSQQAALQALEPSTSSGAHTTLSDSYWTMVQALTRDGRASAADIARETGVHATTASRRLNRLLESNILSFRCELAQAHSGYPISCRWFANVPPEHHDEAAEALRAFQNLRLCASISGPVNFTFVMWLQSVSDVMEAELAIKERVPWIEFVESTLTLNYVKRVGWMLNRDGTATGDAVVARMMTPLSRSVPGG